VALLCLSALLRSGPACACRVVCLSALLSVSCVQAGYNGSQGLSAQLPWGFNYDPEAYPIFEQVQSEPAGAVLHVWSHGWFVNMFEVATMDKADHSVTFATAESYGWTHPKGGWQGGRGWEDTDHTPQTSECVGPSSPSSPSPPSLPFALSHSARPGAGARQT
jgi:hypothetical protein